MAFVISAAFLADIVDVNVSSLRSAYSLRERRCRLHKGFLR
jgi:hypothetical protein